MAAPLLTPAPPAQGTAPAAAGTPARRTTLSARWPVLAAALLGLTLLFGAGFAHPHVLHNATHDTRHAVGFPCH